jgi:hypothetical protein
MTKIERLEAALKVAEVNLMAISSYTGTFGEQAKNTLRAMKEKMEPLPEYEEIEESAGWVNVYPLTGVSISPRVKTGVSHAWATKELADENASGNRIDCQEIKVKVRREKVRTVERSVTVAVTLRGDGVITAPCPTPIQPFMQHPDFHGCKGSLTFTTTDPPK